MTPDQFGKRDFVILVHELGEKLTIVERLGQYEFQGPKTPAAISAKCNALWRWAACIWIGV
jgi:hypothetical protein